MNGNGIPDSCEGDCDGDGTPDDMEADCDHDGTPDDCENEPDCNGNNIPDSCDIAAGAQDMNGNGIPDSCEGDCDGDGIPDDMEADCDHDGTPDDCEGEPDCNGNHIPDSCDIAAGAQDMNGNGIPDSCEADCDGDGTPDDMESDCDHDGTPDDCEGEPDCNNNHIPDSCDIAAGHADMNGNGIPDSCEGDCDGDGTPDDMEQDCDGNGIPDECEGCDTVTLTWDADDCAGPYNDFSEFTAEQDGSCANVTIVASTLDSPGGHSCTDDALTGTAGGAFCIDKQNESTFDDDDSDALTLTVTITESGGVPAKLEGFSFYQQAPEYYFTSQQNGSMSSPQVNDRPQLYGISIRRDGVEIFQQTGLPTALAWQQETFDFSNDPNFAVTSGSAEFEIYLLAYQDADLWSPDDEVWDLDQFVVEICCNGSSIVDCDDNGIADGCDDHPDCNDNGIPDVCDIADGTSHDVDGDGMPDECRWDFCADEVYFDPTVSSWTGGDHAFIFFEVFPGIFKRFLLDQGVFSERPDGTATLTGLAYDADNPNAKMMVAMTLSGLLQPGDAGYPPAGSPQKFLLPGAYVENGGTVDSDTWRYYPTEGGTLTGMGDLDGLLITIEDSAHPALQVGEGANGANLELGLGAWLDITVVSPPNQGANPFFTGMTADVNLNLVHAQGDCDGDGIPDCAEVDCDGNGTPDECEQGCADSLSIQYDMNDCLAFADSDSFSEFVGTVVGDCANLSVTPTPLYGDEHSCTDDAIDGAPGNAFCVSADSSSSYSTGDSDRIRFQVEVTESNGAAARVKGFSFYEQAPVIYVQSDAGGFFNTGNNNYPTLYTLRILRDGVEIFRAEDQATALTWSQSHFEFGDDPSFTVTSATVVFEFELLSYAPSGSAGNKSIWDLDQFSVDLCCDDGLQVEDCDGDGIPDGCDDNTDCNSNGIPDNCEIADDPSLDDNGNGIIDSCEEIVCADDVHFDPALSSYTGGAHSLIFIYAFPNNIQRFLSTGGASFVEFPNGTAAYNAVVEDPNNSAYKFQIDVTFAGRIDPGDPNHPPAGSPQLFLLPSAYVDNGGTIDPSTWRYYPVMQGTLTGLDGLAGTVFSVAASTAAPQIGLGANGANGDFGFGSWLDLTLTSPPNDPTIVFPTDFTSDINLNFSRDDCDNDGTPDCLEPDCDDNGIPDDCEQIPDCNGNTIPDNCDIADGTSQDQDGNGVPDECEPETPCDDFVAIDWDLDDCYASSSDGSTHDYSEFTPSISGICSGSIDDASTVFRTGGGHSCTDDRHGNAGKAMCVDFDNNPIFIADHPDSVRFSVTADGPTQLEGLSFWQLAPAQYTWSSPTSSNVNTGQNNPPTLFGVRVLKDGVQIFQQDGISTAMSSWAQSVFLFDGPEFNVASGTATFEFELFAYALQDGFSNHPSVWDLDDIQVRICCDDCDGDGISNAHEADCDANGIPDDCESHTDCNGNGIPDVCDIAAGTSMDMDGNGVPDECPKTFCVNQAVGDGVVGDAYHAIWMSVNGNAQRFIFDTPAVAEVQANGDLVVTGEARRDSDPDEKLILDVTFGGRVNPGDANHPPAGSPKLTTALSDAIADTPTVSPLGGNGQADGNTAYNAINPANWYYYLTTNGTLTGAGDLDGLVLTFTRRGEAFQVGAGASQKNLHQGASGWLDLVTTAQPTSGHTFPSTFVGDFNWDIVICDGFGDDLCTNATDIGCDLGKVDFDVTNANTDGPAQPNDCMYDNNDQVYNDVWFRWTAPCDGDFRFATLGLTDVDTKIMVYVDGDCANLGAPVTCGDFSWNTWQSTADLWSTGGVTYLIRLGTYNPNATGYGEMSISQLSAPCAMSACGD
ncbi:MAG: hypothetical protein AAF581_17500 [Planctomycetota bacterium]